MLSHKLKIMIIKRKVGPKGQVVIPKDIRDLLKIKPGSEIIIEIKKNEIIIRPAENEDEFLKKFFKTSKKLTEKIDIKKQLEEHYEH